MAPKAENKQGRFILRVVIIFPSQIAELSICSIMRLRTFCGDNSQKTTILYRSHTEPDQSHVLEENTLGFIADASVPSFLSSTL